MTPEDIVQQTLQRNQRIVELAHDCLFINAYERQETLNCIMEKGEDGSPAPDAETIFKRENLISDENIEFLIQFDAHLETRRQDQKFGQIAVANGFTQSDKVEKALEYQKTYFTRTGINVTIGDLLVDDRAIRPQERISILLTQNRIKDEDLLDAINGLGRNKMQKTAINKRFGVLAIQENLVTRDQVNQALEVQKREENAGGTSRFIGRILQETASLSEKDMHRVLVRQKQVEKRRLDLEKALYTVQSEIKISKKINQLYQYTISKDGTQAFLEKKKTTRTVPVSVYELRIWLRRVGIRFGIADDPVLDHFLRGDGSTILVAKGYPPEPCTDEAAEFYFPLAPLTDDPEPQEEDPDPSDPPQDVKPEPKTDPESDSDKEQTPGLSFEDVTCKIRDELNDWSPDEKSQESGEPSEKPDAHVKKGDILARVLPGKTGTPGKDVMGHPIHPAKPGICYLNAGPGVAREDDAFYARIDGRPVLKNGVTLLVEPIAKESPVRIIHKNLSEDTLDQYRDVQVEVRGSITAEGKIQCRSLLVNGDVMGQAICSEAVEVKGNIGENRRVEETQSLPRAKIISRGTVRVLKSIRYSDIQTAGELSAFNSTLTGSHVLAGKGMIARDVLNGDFGPCILQFGLDPEDVILEMDHALEMKKKQLSELQQESRITDLAEAYQQDLQKEHERQDHQTILKNLTVILQAPELEQIDGLENKIEHLKRLPDFSSIKAFYLQLPVTDTGIDFMNQILSSVKKMDPENILDTLRNQMDPEPEDGTKISHIFRIQTEFQDHLSAVEEQVKGQSKAIGEVEAEIHRLETLRAKLASAHARSLTGSGSQVEIRNMCEKGTVIKGKIAGLVLEKTVHHVRFKETMDPKTRRAVIVTEDY